MDSLSTMIIYILHTLLILFIISVPFMNNNYLALLHFIIIPFIMLHWILNDHTCSIVFVEKKMNKLLFGYDESYRGFFANLIEPVYDFKRDHNNYAVYIYGITGLLWLLSSSKLLIKYKNGEIKSINDLFKS